MLKTQLLSGDLIFYVRFIQRVFNEFELRYHLVAVTDGNVALRAMCNTEFNLILLDLTPPRVDGFELLRTLRDIPSTSGVPVIYFCSSGEEGDRVRTDSLGVARCVRKVCDYGNFKKNLLSAFLRQRDN